MTFKGVPWAIEHAEVDSAVARGFANAATRDSQGIVLPGDFKVTAFGAAGPGVNIAPGGMILRSYQAPGQSYIGQSLEVTPHPIPATAGSHLLVARVRDPDYAPWQPYTTENQILYGPYFEPYLLTGVNPTTTSVDQVRDRLNYTAEAIARIDNPGGAANITGDMIKELGIRKLAQPRVAFAYDVQPGPALDYVTTSETAWHHWPLNSLGVDVPRWATHAQVEIVLNGIKSSGPNDVELRAVFGTLDPGMSVFHDYNGNTGTPAGFVEVLPKTIYGEFVIPPAMRGTRQVVRPDARRDPRYNTVNTGNVWFEPAQQVAFSVTFSERLV